LKALTYEIYIKLNTVLTKCSMRVSYKLTKLKIEKERVKKTVNAAWDAS
jgi:hypothetical protein